MDTDAEARPSRQSGKCHGQLFYKNVGGRDVGTAKPGPVSKGEEFDGKVISSIE